MVNLLPSDRFCFLVVGNKFDLGSLGENIFCLGRLKSIDAMAEAYSAADICLVPSLSENLPYVALESILCKTPVLAFNTGGMKDIVTHKVNGYLANKFDVKDLISGVNYLVSDNFKIDIIDSLSIYNESKVIAQYYNLYEEIIQG